MIFLFVGIIVFLVILIDYLLYKAWFKSMTKSINNIFDGLKTTLYVFLIDKLSYFTDDDSSDENDEQEDLDS
jgi:hypothetical protein